MMKIAETIAKENDCLALVTGESIGQVASQTMQSLAVTNEVCEPSGHETASSPSISRNIVDISLKIGTYETSVLPYEDCCTIFVAKHPVTKPSLKKDQKFREKKLDEKIDELMKTASGDKRGDPLHLKCGLGFPVGLNMCRSTENDVMRCGKKLAEKETMRSTLCELLKLSRQSPRSHASMDFGSLHA